jgi:sulfoxide reductase heme-binding subunit YedZ
VTRLAAATSGGSALWFLSRGTGVVVLVLLTVVVVLGVLSRRGTGPGRHTFVLTAIHRNASLLAVVLLVVHVVTAVLDPYAPIRVMDAVVPFTSAYRPIWLGLGALASDLLVALIATSLLRVRLGLRSWRAIHWSAYLAWPVALVHGVGTGSDTRRIWNLLVVGACLAAVVVATLMRARIMARRLPVGSALVRLAAVGAPVLLGGWMILGPLAPGWAARAGMPLSELASAVVHR